MRHQNTMLRLAHTGSVEKSAISAIGASTRVLLDAGRMMEASQRARCQRAGLSGSPCTLPSGQSSP